ncbi:MAG: RidA family protein [Gemmatimonadota bacterium]|nr:MAG: RidA family protein [Gemmatimonadota bacterium]
MEFVSTKKAPEAIGPYSQAVIANGLVFTAGQIALDPASMTMVGDDVARQTERVLQNLAAVLAEAGCTLSDVVKTTVYLADMADFSVMNEVYAKHFGDHRPARATVEAAALPKGGLVEIDAIAVRS